ncbi:MAG: hypothetical protein GZ091_13960 [Paludibacter sp.]|nr:hypothetical protein [Paludibacter sp.]
MAKWKCNNPACLNEWSEKDPTCCPQCGSTDFEQIGSVCCATGWTKIAKIAGGVVAVIIFLLLLKNCGDTKDVTATITFKASAGSIKVELNVDNDNKNDFVIEILRSGTPYESAKGLKSKTFVGLMPGSYYVNVQYIGKKTGSDRPNITYDKTKGPYIIDTPPPSPPPPPSIVSVTPVPNKKTLKYTLTIKIHPDSISKLCEFSIDGKDFFPSNIFNNVSAGTYNNIIEVRLIDDNSIHDIYQLLILPPIVNTPPPSQTVIQALLNKISNSDDNAFNQLSDLLSTGNIKVSGAGGSINTLYDLMVDCNSENNYTIQNMTVVNNEIISINVRKTY